MAGKKRKKSQKRARAKVRGQEGTGAVVVLPTSESAGADSQSALPTFPSSSPETRKAFWDTFVRAVEAEPVEARPLRGASGLVHPITALGFDQARKRIIVISGDPDGRSAALAQADIQAANPDYKVIFARPIAINLPKVAESVSDFFGKREVSSNDLERFSKLDERTRERFLAMAVFPSIRALGYAVLNVHATLQDVLMQLSHVQFIVNAAPTPTGDTPTELRSDSPVIRFGSLVALDPAELDRQTGICSVPLYELCADEAEVFHTGQDIDMARECLKRHQVFQYFFPAPDSLALGLIEKNHSSSANMPELLRRPSEIGHPLGASELVDAATSLEEIVDALKQNNLAVEGEIGLELTENGKVTRASVRFKPREAFLSKLSNVISVKVDLNLKDLKDLIAH